MGKFFKVVAAIVTGLFIYDLAMDALEDAFGDPDDNYDDGCCYYDKDEGGYDDEDGYDDPDDVNTAVEEGETTEEG